MHSCACTARAALTTPAASTKLNAVIAKMQCLLRRQCCCCCSWQQRELPRSWPILTFWFRLDARRLRCTCMRRCLEGVQRSTRKWMLYIEQVDCSTGTLRTGAEFKRPGCGSEPRCRAGELKLHSSSRDGVRQLITGRSAAETRSRFDAQRNEDVHLSVNKII